MVDRSCTHLLIMTRNVLSERKTVFKLIRQIINNALSLPSAAVSERRAYGAFPDHMAANEAELVIIISPTFGRK